MSHSLLHTLAFGIWAMRPECAAGYTEQVDAILAGRQAVEAHSQTELEQMRSCDMHFVAQDGRRLDVGAEPLAPEQGLVAVLSITGAVMKEDCMRWPGTSTMARWLAEFEATPEVSGVVLVLDSPGGNGYAMLTLTQQIERMTKPVVAHVSAGMACSACYGIAAATDLIYSGTDVDEFGSIGTYVRLANWDKAAREHKTAPLEVHTIKATRSKRKLHDVEEALKADPSNAADPHYKALREGYVDPFNEHFIGLVQRNRPGVEDKDGVLEGAVFMAPAALERGLIDATGKTLADAIGAVREMTKRNPKETTA